MNEGPGRGRARHAIRAAAMPLAFRELLFFAVAPSNGRPDIPIIVILADR